MFFFGIAPRKRKEPLTEFLIHDIQAHPLIWNKLCKDYKDVIIKNNASAIIQANLKSSFTLKVLTAAHLDTLKGIKGHWKNICDTFRRKAKEYKGMSGADLEQVLKKKKNGHSMKSFNFWSRLKPMAQEFKAQLVISMF